MKFYLEVTALRDSGINENTILSDVCSILHDTLSRSYKARDIGVSFPQYSYNKRSNKGTLGAKLRIFAPTKEALEQLDLAHSLSKMDDYIHLSGIEEVGDKATHYEVYTRCRYKNTRRKAEKLYQHFLDKHGEDVLVEKFGDFQGVLEHCENTNKHYKHLPFIGATSNSNGHYYIIRLERTKMDKPTDSFEFNNFGINSKSRGGCTVPAW